MNTTDPEDQQMIIPGTDTPPDKLTQLLALSRRLEEGHLELVELSKKAEDVAASLKQIEEVHIPTLMSELGMQQFTLASGRTIAVQKEYYASVSKDNTAAFEWLRAHNHGAMIKSEVVIDGSLKDKVAETGLPFRVSESVHPATLRAFVREKMEQKDEEFPKDVFKVYEQERAVIQEPRRR